MLESAHAGAPEPGGGWPHAGWPYMFCSRTVACAKTLAMYVADQALDIADQALYLFFDRSSSLLIN